MNKEIQSIVNLLNAKEKSLVKSNITSRRLVFYHNTYGYYKIIKYIGLNNHYEHIFRIKFINTGYEEEYAYHKIINHEVTDYYVPSVYGIGYLGEKRHKPNCSIKYYTVMYKRWVHMLERCYLKTSNHYSSYGELGVTVSDEWKNFSTFLKDCEKLPGFDMTKIENGELTLDKDKLQQGIPQSNKVYSKDTCCWLSYDDQAKFRDYTITSEQLEEYFYWEDANGNNGIFKGVIKFARMHGLTPSTIYAILAGRLKSTKGYKFSKVIK